MRRSSRLLKFTVLAGLLVGSSVLAADFNYLLGGSDWGGTCTSGLQQSPVNITGAERHGWPALLFNYKETPLTILNNGHTLEAVYESGSSIRLGPDTFRLLQFHFHRYSEHRLDGQQFAMEAHLVPINSSSQLAVVGVLMKLGAPNSVLGTVLANAPKTPSEIEIPGQHVNASDLLPRSSSYFTYTGSLTTPPCTEGVRWFVLKETTEVSADQLASFESFHLGGPSFSFNNRPTQALNGRTIIEKPGQGSKGK